MKNKELKRFRSTKKKFACSYRDCGKVYASNQRLKIHTSQIHLRDYPLFQCPHCDKISKEKSNLIVHMRIHNGAKPYQCKFCSQTFASCGNKNDHQRRHTKQTSHECSLCSAKFYRLTEKNIHLRKHHSSQVIADQVDFKYQQEQCESNQIMKVYMKSKQINGQNDQILMIEQSGPSRQFEGLLQSSADQQSQEIGQTIDQFSHCDINITSIDQRSFRHNDSNLNENQAHPLNSWSSTQSLMNHQPFTIIGIDMWSNQLISCDFGLQESIHSDSFIKDDKDIQQKLYSIKQTFNTKENEGQELKGLKMECTSETLLMNEMPSGNSQSLKNLLFEKLIDHTCFSEIKRQEN